MKAFLSSFITFRTIIRMSMVYLPPCSFLLALHLDWFLNTSVDKKIKCSFYICEIVFYFILWLKLSIFFSFGSIFPWNLQWKREKLIGKKLNVNRQFFKDVLCVTLLQEGVEQYQFLGKISTHFHNFHLLKLLSNEDFYIFHPPLFITTPVPARPPSF